MMEDKKKLAKELYLHTSRNQSDIARIVGITEATMSAWVNGEGWKNLKQVDSLQQDIRRRILTKIQELLDDPEEKSADKVAKYSAAAARLREREITSTDIIRVMEGFMSFVLERYQSANIEAVKWLNQAQDEFLKFQIAKQ